MLKQNARPSIQVFYVNNCLGLLHNDRNNVSSLIILYRTLYVYYIAFRCIQASELVVDYIHNMIYSYLLSFCTTCNTPLTACNWNYTTLPHALPYHSAHTAMVIYHCMVVYHCVVIYQCTVTYYWMVIYHCTVIYHMRDDSTMIAQQPTYPTTTHSHAGVSRNANLSRGRSRLHMVCSACHSTTLTRC